MFNDLTIYPCFFVVCHQRDPQSKHFVGRLLIVLLSLLSMATILYKFMPGMQKATF